MKKIFEKLGAFSDFITRTLGFPDSKTASVLVRVILLGLIIILTYSACGYVSQKVIKKHFENSVKTLDEKTEKMVEASEQSEKIGADAEQKATLEKEKVEEKQLKIQDLEDERKKLDEKIIEIRRNNNNSRANTSNKPVSSTELEKILKNANK